MRRKRGIEDESVERYSVAPASIAAISRADVVFVVFDSSEEISEQDVRIAGMVHDEGKPSVIVMNKWDKVEKDTHTVEKYNASLAEKLNFMGYFKSEYVSAASGQRVDRLLDLAETVYSHAGMRVPTGVLNDVISDAVRATEPAPRIRADGSKYSTPRRRPYVLRRSLSSSTTRSLCIFRIRGISKTACAARSIFRERR